MAVTLTKSRKLADISPQAGVRAIGVAAFNSLNRVVTTATGVVDLATYFAANTIARLELKNTTTKFLENGISGADNRSTGVTGNLTAVFNVPSGGDLSNVALVEELLKGEVVFFVERYDGVIMACGSQNGALVVTADSDTGGQIGDLNGFMVTFNTLEPDFARKYVLTGTALADYASALMVYV